MKGNDAHIIIADDDMINLEIMTMILEKRGYQNIHSFADGDEAWKYMAEASKDIDLVVLDKMMPRMGAKAVMQEMKKQDNLKNIPVIIQTGDAEEERLKELKDMGVFSCITKPYLDDEFISHIQKALHKKDNDKGS